ncbi:hypothetical protein PTT_15770 [Pyrenophora teres f. teres 0-1]|uniref:HPt domain-containing protein n=2 Tax=Pyrenophora teres f. teres TaxID=97479 RepID=E3S0X3_PYRTT|nr:hypothetical protein PTT_15770 [Pyrenophora teres f. teres 0-1]
MSIPGAEDQIDPATFEQILEMDEDEVEREFSKSIVYDFFGQADQTFKKMDKELEEKKEGKYLKELSELGHFLKGSSATLGLTKVKDSCEKIQHYGQLKDDAGTKDITEEQAQENLAKIIKQAKTEFDDVTVILKKFYADPDIPSPAAPAPVPAVATTTPTKATTTV